jgi:hypothetical protein
VRLALPASPVTAAACDGLTLDASATSGGGGRGLAFEWFVDGTFAGDRSVLAVPDLVAGDSYAVAVVASSFLNVSARAALVVNAVAEAPPTVEVEGGAAASLNRWQALSLFAVAAPSAGCGGESIATYAWEGGPFESTSRDPRYFSLPPSTLAAGATYAFVVTVTDDRGNTNRATATVEVRRSGVVAAVDGGDRSAAAGEAVTLDASRSRDPDDETTTLSFAWTCDGLPCGDGASSLAVNAPAAGVVATYAVLVAAADGRNATASCFVAGALAKSPPTLAAAAPAGKVDPSSRLKIAAAVSGASPGTTFAWSLESGALEESLDAAALAPLVAEAEGDALSVPLVLAAGSLTPGGAYG